MNITGEIKLFVSTKKNHDGTTFQSFTTSVSTKIKDSDDYVTKYVDVRFSGENFPSENLRKLKDDFIYTLEIEDGWLGARSYLNKEDNEIKVLYIFINKGHLKDKKKIEKNKSSDDLPF